MTQEKAEKKPGIMGLDGLRVYAIAMIVACHVGALAEIAGGIGNKIFFTLSGFLAFYSIKNAASVSDALTFYRKRFIRIVPAFWTVLLIAWRMFPGIFSLTDLSTSGSLILNMFFIKNYGHFWFLQHLVLMYLLTPVFLLIYKAVVSLLCRAGSPKLYAEFAAAGTFVIMAVLEKKFLTSDILTLSGEGSHSQFQVWMFLLGFATAIAGDALQNSGFLEKDGSAKTAGKVFTDVYVAALLVLLTVSVIPSVFSSGKMLLLGGDYPRAILSCAAYLMLLLTRDSLIAKFLNCRLLAQLSVLSFGIYLWHFFFLQYFRTGSGLHNFVFNVFISLCLALFTRTVVEKPVSRILTKPRSL